MIQDCEVSGPTAAAAAAAAAVSISCRLNRWLMYARAKDTTGITDSHQ